MFGNFILEKEIKMGYIKHHAIVITGCVDDDLDKAQEYALELAEDVFGNEYHSTNIIGDIRPGICQGYKTFTIIPDGSKDGWETSNKADDFRDKFKDYLRVTSLDWIEVCFGGDDGDTKIVESNIKI